MAKKKLKAYDKKQIKKTLKSIRDIPKKLKEKRKRDIESEKKRRGR